MPGFFNPLELQMVQPASLIPKCGECGLSKTCIHPKMEPSGQGRRKVLIVAEAPGEEEDRKGIQLIGKSGRLLQSVLENIGVDMRKDCWLTNALICRPPRNEIKNPKAIDFCRPNLIKTVNRLKPDVVILLGGKAIYSLIPHVWSASDIGETNRWVGWQAPSQKINAWICPTFHPSYLLRMENKVLDRMFTQHLKQAFKLKGKPWDVVPDYAKQVKLVCNKDEIVSFIDSIKEGIIAFDYECLVPTTKVMTDNFKWVEIGDLKVGDRLTSFEETAKGHWRKLLRGEVTAIKRFIAPCVRITLTDGRVIDASENHPWLASKGIRRVPYWIKSSQLKPGYLIRQVTTQTWETDNTREGGYLAGFFDGEGYITGRGTIGFAQVEGQLFNQTLKLLQKKGFAFGSSEKKINIKQSSRFKTQQLQMMAYCKGLQETLRFVGSIRPLRLIRNLQRNIFEGCGKSPTPVALPKLHGSATVAKVELIGKREVVGVTTDTGTYIAEGLCSHNTNMLKPEHKRARLVSCSICHNGKETIAFPLLPGIQPSLCRLLTDKRVAKIAQNLKYESRWTKAILGVQVRNWHWDTMVAAHILDCRRKVTGLKFLSFVHLGQVRYDDHIEPYLKDQRGGYGENRIDEIPLEKLLTYNGLDSLLEYLVWEKQVAKWGLSK